MAKNEKVAAKAASVETTPVDNLDSTFENLKKGNLISQSVNEKALEEIAKSKEEAQIKIAKNAINEAEYNNLKTVLRLRDQRRRARIAKYTAEETRNLLEGLIGKTDEKGNHVPGTLTPAEYDKKKAELRKEVNEKTSEADKQFREESAELQSKFPNSWAYDNGWDNMIFGRDRW